MEFNCKCMYLGKFVGKTKDGQEFKQVKFLDKNTNDTLVIYCNDFGKYDKQQPYTDCEVKFEMYKDSKGFYRLRLGGEL